MDNLRKVVFTLERFHGTIGDYESAGVDAETVTLKRKGLFHCFGNEPFYDASSQTYRDRMVGIVEEVSTGKVYHVIPEFITFEK